MYILDKHQSTSFVSSESHSFAQNKESASDSCTSQLEGFFKLVFTSTVNEIPQVRCGYVHRKFQTEVH